MPVTPTYSLPFEKNPEDLPGKTLHGGPAGTDPILAEAVETEIIRVDDNISDLDERLTAIETGHGPFQSASWRPIATGTTGSVDSFQIDLTDDGRFTTPPRWNLVRVYMRFDLNDSGGGTARVNMQINGDNSPSYNSGFITYDADGNLDLTSHLSDGGSWRIAHGATISTNNLILTLFHTASDPGLINFQCESARHSSGSNVHRRTFAWGALGSGGLTPEFLSFETFGGADGFNNAWWWAEGARFN